MPEPGPQSYTVNAVERIGFGKRLAAAALDVVIIVAVGGLTGAATGAVLGGMAGAEMEPANRGKGAAAGCLIGAALGFALGTVLVSPLYSLWEGLTGAAAGKRFFRIRIARADGSRASVVRLVARYLIKKSYAILLLMGLVAGSEGLRGLGVLAGLAIFAGCFLALNRRRQALHDRLARTAVFKSDDIQ